MVRIIFPILGGLVVLIVIIGKYFIRQRQKRDIKEQRNTVNTHGLLSILNFEGKLMYEEIIRATNNFDSEYSISSGGYVSVCKAELPLGNVFAIKKFYSQHPMEMGNQKVGSLATILSNEADTKELGWRNRMNIMEDVANALSYMHHDWPLPIVHRDISSKNAAYEPHVSNFGTAKFLKPDSSSWSKLVGTYGYVALELAYTMNITKKCDDYSFRVLILEIIKGNHSRDLLSSFPSLSSNVNLPLSDMLDPRLATPSRDVQDKLIFIMEVTFSCLDANPESRPDM
ncbi:MDIS1-interacting receptor like kinase 2-like [Pistacia vera]|uniref:MDIS1-interacting receptor like kinase 2-like n=1 Tax=Pistacia vera TaxID=55513 RepID=UPI0012631D07|nr:MDIS1-interacting receptor like kinase 2-like [Pistacia vera]